jgi:hypothetical protein
MLLSLAAREHLFAMKALKACSTSTLSHQVSLKLILQLVQGGFDHKHLASGAEDFDLAVAFRRVLFGVTKLKIYLAVRALYFDL